MRHIAGKGYKLAKEDCVNPHGASTAVTRGVDRDKLSVSDLCSLTIAITATVRHHQIASWNSDALKEKLRYFCTPSARSCSYNSAGIVTFCCTMPSSPFEVATSGSG